MLRVNDYLSVLMIQLDMMLDCTPKYEYLIETDSFLGQISKAFEIMQEKSPDITLFPEMSYIEKFENNYKIFSRNNKIVIAGSYYKEGINTTVVFQDEKKYEIPKSYASGAEPMARNDVYTKSWKEPKDYVQTNLKKHEFWIKGKKIYIFNCMEYYNLAYYVARDYTCKDNLFGVFSVCSNSNTHVFEEETIVTHNHNESIYTFMLNCVSTYKGEKYGDGQSYIYGPITIHEKEWLVKDGILSKESYTHILSLREKKAQYAYGDFLVSERLSKFGRSDNYVNNPRNVEIGEL